MSKSKSNLLVKDASDKIYRLCSFFIKQSANNGDFLKVMFHNLRFRPTDESVLTEEAKRMNEVSSHYHAGVLTFKQNHLRVAKSSDNDVLEKRDYLPLFSIELLDLLCLEEFNVTQQEYDTLLNAPWIKPRGLFFFLSKNLIEQPLVFPAGSEVLGIYDLRDDGTGLFLKIADYHLPCRGSQNPPMRIRTFKGTAEPQLFRITPLPMVGSTYKTSR